MVYVLPWVIKFSYLNNFRKVSLSICACFRIELKVPGAIGLICGNLGIFWK